MQMMLGTVVDFSRDVDPQLWRRFLAIVLDGLRARPGQPPLPVPPLDVEQLDVAMGAWRGSRPGSQALSACLSSVVAPRAGELTYAERRPARRRSADAARRSPPYRRPMPALRHLLPGCAAGLLAAALLAPRLRLRARPRRRRHRLRRRGLLLRPSGRRAPPPVRVDLDDGEAPFTTAGGCVQDSAVRAYCTVGDDGLRIDLGNGDDRLDVAPESALGFALVADGGAGSDRLTGAFGVETLLGGDGDDALDGRGGDDRLDGGPGLDQLDGGAGGDLVLGGDGDDRLVGDGLFAPAPDLLDGGTGRDTVEDWSPAGPGPRGLLTIGVDDGPGDGFAGEGDELRAVEVLRITSPGTIAGCESADEITVVNGPTRVNGRGGDDLLYGGVDADTLDGGAGAGPEARRRPGRRRDRRRPPAATSSAATARSRASFGNDAIDAVDGEPDSASTAASAPTRSAPTSSTPSPATARRSPASATRSRSRREREQPRKDETAAGHPDAAAERQSAAAEGGAQEPG